ncbi:MAG TPA: transposase [Thermoanaerobaculia bacterium]|nr:transposase [Thermoanaerobaculia bacterium]
MTWTSNTRERTGDTVLDWTQQWQDAGRRKGGAELLLRQAERKFGPLGHHDRLRIELAPHERLLDWGERLVVARSLEEVFRW